MTEDPARSRRLVYTLLITVALSAAAGRIMNSGLVYEPSIHRNENDPNDTTPRIWPKHRPAPMPTYGANDRSRWATIRALVDDGTYVVGRRDPALVSETNKYGDTGIVSEPGWGTIDKVLHPDRQEFYSSKPPLLPTIVAGEYWLLKKLFGWSITDQTNYVVRTILFTFNWLPMLLYLVLLARLVERFGTTDWGRTFVLAAGCFGTLMTPFLVTFNNHTLAACLALFALCAALRALEAEWTMEEESNSTSRRSPNLIIPFALAGLFAGLTAAAELPAAAFLAALFLILLLRSPFRALCFFLPAAALPVAALLWTNYLAIGQIAPAYSELGGPWYQYEGSHWKTDPAKPPQGIDHANDDKHVYAFHFLLGHHGLLALTPIYFLTIAGVVFLTIAGVARWVRGYSRAAPSGGQNDVARVPAISDEEKTTPSIPYFLFPLTAFLAVVVVGFYIVKTHNYGGWTCGPRWLLWLTPFFLLTMLPIADRLGQSRWGRGLGYLLLAVSIASASYPSPNPWRHPWIFNFMEAQGWIAY